MSDPSQTLSQSVILQSVVPSMKIERLSAGNRRSLVLDLNALKTVLPEVWITLGPEPYSHNLSALLDIFTRAGIQPVTALQQPEDPDQTGLMICVPDVKQVPELARRLADILAKYDIKISFIKLNKKAINANLPADLQFVVFIGPASL